MRVSLLYRWEERGGQLSRNSAKGSVRRCQKPPPGHVGSLGGGTAVRGSRVCSRGLLAQNIAEAMPGKGSQDTWTRSREARRPGAQPDSEERGLCRSQHQGVWNRIQPGARTCTISTGTSDAQLGLRLLLLTALQLSRLPSPPPAPSVTLPACSLDARRVPAAEAALHPHCSGRRGIVCFHPSKVAL
ncbi:unnamed protein product [Rangifer tarandus platyrhynchus]|uniref:Uncharacterized protein n=1 Tax=Rangifer tarandus platyrhynchus TaxID=3082113 RepID=A0AC59YHS9_RANTA